ncbi:MAG: acyl-CoA dehydrogenase family protein [Candidatus Delongbacteria bacterium]|nr:acyl-CoA dehydrogenase family protein [Candidatus Cloacimonadota bacterium]MCB9472857.1 acyl-CoA dehydrogenase family protein [Candidatus Delongbacteria bacterium]
MDFLFTEEQLAVQEMTRRFAREKVLPGVRERDENAEIPDALRHELLEMGYGAMMVPEEWGGMGMDSISYSLALEEISAVDAALAVALSVTNSLGCAPLLRFGTEAQREKYLRPLCDGRMLAAFCLSEAGAGSDVRSLETRIEREGDEYVITGSKMWVTNGSRADLFLVIGSSGPEVEGRSAKTALLVEKGTPGLSLGKLEDKLGLRCSDTALMHFDKVRVPAGNLLHEEGKGLHVALGMLDGGRIGIASQSLGLARGAFELALDYARQREQFGKTIDQFQLIQFKFADMATRIEAARNLVYKACSLRDAGLDYSRYAAMAKLYASETANFCARECVQIHGGYGYSREYHAERFMRDARVTEIYEGTSEIQRIVIARSVMA